ncbi:MAG: hypothetical protein LCH67_17615 [Bacteroidetes bacterium]|nr:hypothetical protein [Bacteroidota bacterium]
MDLRRKWFKVTSWVLIGVLMGFTLYCSWVPLPQMEKMGIFPGWLSAWADAPQNQDLRTAVPFLFMGFLISLRFKKIRLWLGITLAGASLLLAEAGQLFLVKRHFSWLDIGYGLAGLLIGTFSGLRFNSMIRSQKIRSLKARKSA